MAWRTSVKRVRPIRRKEFSVERLEDRTLLASGFLDPTFGAAGKVLTPVGASDAQATSSVLQSDGKILVAGFSASASTGQDFALVRYNSSGTLDTSFGTGGKVTTDFFGGNDQALGVAEMPDGRIIAAGFATNAGVQEFALARYLANGSLDPNFGNGGKVVTSIGGFGDEATAIQLQSNGSIVVAGFSRQIPSSIINFVVARYDVNGSLDPSFGSNGVAATNFTGTSGDTARALLIQPDGKIVVAGASGQMTNTVFALARFDAQGKLDTTFGTGGKVTTNLAGQDDEANSLAIQTDGKLVVAGSTKIGGFLDFAVVRYGSDGKLDSSFGTGGRVATDFAGRDDKANAVVLQPDGKIIAAGSATVNGSIDMGLVRYTDAGAVDGTFGTNGTTVTDFGAGFAGINALFLASDRTVTGAGFAVSGATKQFALARYLGDPVQAGQLDPSFGVSGQVHFQFGSGVEHDVLNDSILQSDGRIIAVGSFSVANSNLTQFGVARFNTDGSPDTSFGTGGGAITGFGPSNDGVAYGVALQTDGKIVVAGAYSQFHIALARYLPNGTLDTSFGNQGRVTTAFTSDEFATSVLVQANGKILVAGSGVTPQNNRGFLLARFDPDGSVDQSFGFGGFVTTDFGPSDAAINRIIFQSDGSIIAVGYTAPSPRGGNIHFVVVRYTPAGGLDPTFNGNGEVLVNFPEGGPVPLGGAVARGVALQPDRKIVVAGDFTGQDFSSELVVARFNSDGSPDPTFNGSGHVAFHGVQNQNLGGNDVALQANGKIIVAGLELEEPSGENFLLQRYNSNGTLDPTFGSNGTVITTVAPNDNSSASRVLIQSDGKIVAAGTSGGFTARQFGLVRYFADPTGPQANAGGTYTVQEGGTVQLDASGSIEPGQPGATLTYQWDLNGNGIYGETGGPATNGDEVGVTPTFIARGIDAPANYKVRLRVTDQQGLTNYATATVLVTEAQPIVAIAGAASVNEGATYTLSLSATDPGPDPFTKWTITWGDGTIQTVAGSPPSVSHVFLSESAGDTISAAVTNADGTFSAGNTATVVVNLVPPTVGISGSSVADQGEVYTLNLSAVEPGLDTITKWSINWGDNTSSNVTGGALTATHIYGNVTTNYTISATATDEDGSYTTNTVTVAVSFLPLVLSLVGPSFAIPGQVYTLQPTSNKPLTSTISSWTINWGDGSVQTFPGKPASVTHTYAAVFGNYTISGSATDTNGTHAASNTISLTATFPTQNQNFVGQVYEDVLARAVEPFGLASWSGFLDAGGSRATVVQGIEGSTEYRTDQIDNYYTSLLGRAADTGSVTAFLEFLQTGGTLEQIRTILIGSDEYFGKAGGTNDAFLKSVYQVVLGRAPDADGETHWLNKLAQGSTRQQVADLILRSEEASNDAVNSLYLTLLHRPAEPSGQQGWVADLLNGVTQEQVAAYIAGSAEYYNRV